VGERIDICEDGRDDILLDLGGRTFLAAESEQYLLDALRSAAEEIDALRRRSAYWERKCREAREVASEATRCRREMAADETRFALESLLEEIVRWDDAIYQRSRKHPGEVRDHLELALTRLRWAHSELAIALGRLPR
jgi:hypothetical protein